MNFKKSAIIAFLCFLLILCSCGVYADEEEQRQKHKGSITQKTQVSQEASAFSERLKARSYASFYEGYDNNVFLNSARENDMFDQFMYGTEVKYRLNNQLDLAATYDFTSITYHDYKSLSLVDNEFSASLQYYIGKHIKLDAGYELDLVTYLDNSGADFKSDGPFAAIRYYFTPSSYIGAGYSYEFFDYTSRKVRDSINQVSAITREDHRHNIKAEAATTVGKLLVKIKNTYYFNESNDGFMDYYDYQSDKASCYLTYPVAENIFLIGTGGYQRKEYKSRKITTSSSKEEHDDLMILGAGLYYRLTSRFYINTSYTYRQNYSNDPIQEYSGSIVTAGFNYFF
jgi:opacity protein-like surface antigen